MGKLRRLLVERWLIAKLLQIILMERKPKILAFLNNIHFFCFEPFDVDFRPILRGFKLFLAYYHHVAGTAALRMLFIEHTNAIKHSRA